jgi:hypothetical protein
MEHDMIKSTYCRFLSLLLFLVVSTSLSQQNFYNRFFTDKTMRVDYFHTGTKGSETISLNNIYIEGEWPGSKVNLIDTMNYGEYYFRVFDFATSMEIYSRGYSTMFNEWLTTDEAGSGMFRTFHESVRFPYPKEKIQVTVLHRDNRMMLHEVFSTVIDPNPPSEINREEHTSNFKVVPLMVNGAPENKVDILILGDGYTKDEMDKFRKDAKHFNDVMFGTAPFSDRKKDFNVRTIEVVSEESGIDKPDKNIWKNNALGCRYSTFGSARYVLTESNKTLRDIASAAPYEFITILINDNRYGGGGIYNLYTTTFANTDVPGMEWQRDYVYVHEFGHEFGGLGDEYYTSETAYNDFYPKGVEPWEPNITALNDPKNIKWKKFVDTDTPVPTPWEKSQYDSLGKVKSKLDRLAPDYYQKRAASFEQEQKLLKNTKYAGKVGAFQGAGYASEGFYRPAADCRMFTLTLGPFDPVCSDAISRMIDFYTK